MTKSDYTEANLRDQSEAAAHLLASLNDDDAELQHDMVEGETDFFETVEIALSQIVDASAIAIGCKAQEAILAERRGRADAKSKKLKSLIEQAFAIAGVTGHVFPIATLTQKNLAQQCIIEDEALLPAKYWIVPDPVLSKAAISTDVKAGEDVPGARLSNGGTTLQIRWK